MRIGKLNVLADM